MRRRLVLTAIALCFSAVIVNGQCMQPNCQESDSPTCENIVTALEEHDNKLQFMHKNLSSALEAFSGSFKDSNTVYAKMEEQQYLNNVHSNGSAIFESIQALSEDVDRRFEANDQSLKSIYENLSTQIDEKLDQFLAIVQQTLTNASLKESKNLEALQIANDKIVDQLMGHDRRLQTMQENFSSAVEKLTEKPNSVRDCVIESLNFSASEDYCRGNPELCDCSTIKANGYTADGVYRIYVDSQNQRHYANASCDMTTSNGAWTVFQRRKDGSVDFYRGWSDYVDGFGDPNGEFWLGNEFIYFLTSKRRYRLRIDLEDFDGRNRYAEYSTFSISSSSDKYRLSIGTFSGTAGNSLAYHNGSRFSTKDADNDSGSGNCAVTHRGPWWHHSCYVSNLNGVYKRGRYLDCGRCGIEWQDFRSDSYSLKTTEMKISPIS